MHVGSAGSRLVGWLVGWLAGVRVTVSDAFVGVARVPAERVQLDHSIVAVSQHDGRHDAESEEDEVLDSRAAALRRMPAAAVARTAAAQTAATQLTARAARTRGGATGHQTRSAAHYEPHHCDQEASSSGSTSRRVSSRRISGECKQPQAAAWMERQWGRRPLQRSFAYVDVVKRNVGRVPRSVTVGSESVVAAGRLTERILRCTVQVVATTPFNRCSRLPTAYHISS